MKDIKFRAWDKDRKKMSVVLSIGWYKDDNGEVKHNVQVDDGKWRLAIDDSFILMQLTGLLDKNGKEIYEGDIVEWEGVNGGIPGGRIGRKDVINYDNKEACFKFGNLSFVEDANQFNNNFPDYDGIEIIGNIYENLELLEKTPALREGL